MKTSKVDCLNHLVAFVSTVLGIFIAFQMDDWQERRSQEEKVRIALLAIRKEIEHNMSTYGANRDNLGPFIEYVNFVRKNFNEKNELVTSERELNLHKSKRPDRFQNLSFIRKLNDTLNAYTMEFKMDELPSTSIAINNWEAAKSSGVLFYVDHSRMALMTEIYDWTQKEIGMSGFYKRLITGENFTDIDEMIRNYTIIKQESEIKLKQIEVLYKQIDWNRSD